MGGGSSNKRRQKPLKALKSRMKGGGGGGGGGEERGGKEDGGAVDPRSAKVRDDADGHLLYSKGDILDSRCTHAYTHAHTHTHTHCMFVLHDVCVPASILCVLCVSIASPMLLVSLCVCIYSITDACLCLSV